jgi:hypothetical protein
MIAFLPSVIFKSEVLHDANRSSVLGICCIVYALGVYGHSEGLAALKYLTQQILKLDFSCVWWTKFCLSNISCNVMHSVNIAI